MDSKGTHNIAAPAGTSHGAENDSLFVSPTTEDMLRLFWQRNKKIVYACILAIIVGIGAVQLWQNYKRDTVLKMQASFLEATTSNQWDSFVSDYYNCQLGALGALHEADKAWSESDFEKAMHLYNKSAKALLHTPLQGRIQLAQALCFDQLGEKAAATIKLKTVLEDGSLLQADRAQAAYQLALLSLKAKDFAQAKDYLDRASAIPTAGVWAQKASLLMGTAPELNEQNLSSSPTESAPATAN